MKKETKALLYGAVTIAAMFGGSYISKKLGEEPVEKVPLLENAGFQDITKDLGIRFNYEYPLFDRFGDNDVVQERTKYRRHYIVGPGITVGDVNHDGFMDFFVATGVQGGKNSLFISNKGKSFTDEAEKWGVAITNGERSSATSSLFFDYNKDSKPDLYINGLGCTKLFRNDGDRFTDVTEQSRVGDCKNSQGAIPFDIDNDGNLDLYVYRYFANADVFDLHLMRDRDALVNELRWRTFGKEIIEDHLATVRTERQYKVGVHHACVDIHHEVREHPPIGGFGAGACDRRGVVRIAGNQRTRLHTTILMQNRAVFGVI